jgi:hypothetical protein
MIGGNTMLMYRGTFKKASGELREMKFVKVKDLPPTFLTNKIKTTNNKPHALKEGQELVWDLDSNDFRIFNWSQVQGQITELDFNFDTWYNDHNTNNQQ